jgi:hypothetical protein
VKEIIIGRAGASRGAGVRTVGPHGSGVVRNIAPRHGTRVVSDGGCFGGGCGGWGGGWGYPWWNWGYPYAWGYAQPVYVTAPATTTRQQQIQEAYLAWQGALREGSSPDVVARLRAHFEALVLAP